MAWLRKMPVCKLIITLIGECCFFFGRSCKKYWGIGKTRLAWTIYAKASLFGVWENPRSDLWCQIIWIALLINKIPLFLLHYYCRSSPPLPLDNCIATFSIYNIVIPFCYFVTPQTWRKLVWPAEILFRNTLTSCISFAVVSVKSWFEICEACSVSWHAPEVFGL